MPKCTSDGRYVPLSPADTMSSVIRSPAESTTRTAASTPVQHRPSWRSRLLTAVLLAFGLGILAGGIGFRAGGLHLSPVLSNSMRPAFSAGDLVVTSAVPTSSLVVGDVIVFVPPGQSEPVAHRIAAIEGSTATTHGDANSLADPWQVQLTDATTQRVVATVPYLGWSTQLHRPLLIAAALLVGVVLLLEIGREVGKRLQRT